MSNPVNGSLNLAGGNFAIATIAAATPLRCSKSTVRRREKPTPMCRWSYRHTRRVDGNRRHVDYTTVAGSATTPEDYEAGVDPLTGTLNFAPGDTTQSISLVLVGDDQFENPPVESFTVVLANPLEATIGAGTGTATITDDDTDLPGQLRYTSAAFTVDESQVTAVVTVERVGGAVGEVTGDVQCRRRHRHRRQDFMAGARC